MRFPKKEEEHVQRPSGLAETCTFGVMKVFFMTGTEGCIGLIIRHTWV